MDRQCTENTPITARPFWRSDSQNVGYGLGKGYGMYAKLMLELASH
jgi:hypothetical protein